MVSELVKCCSRRVFHFEAVLVVDRRYVIGDVGECMVCIEVSSQYCVVCVQYVRHTVCYVFLRVRMIRVCSVSWRYVYIENIEMFVVG